MNQNQEEHPDTKFHIKLHSLELREETKESFQGQENAEVEDDLSESYFEFPQACTGDVNSEVVDKISFARISLASPRKPNIIEPKAVSRFSRGRKSNPFGAEKSNSLVARVQTDAYEFNPFNTKRIPHPSFRRLQSSQAHGYHNRKYSETMPDQIDNSINDNVPFNDQLSNSVTSQMK